MQEISLPVRKERLKETEEAFKLNSDGFDQMLQGGEEGGHHRKREQPKKSHGEEIVVWRIISVEQILYTYEGEIKIRLEGRGERL